MKEELMRLHDALSTISTRGNDTMTMANCLGFLRNKIAELEKEETKEDDQ